MFYSIKTLHLPKLLYLRLKTTEQTGGRKRFLLRKQVAAWERQ